MTSIIKLIAFSGAKDHSPPCYTLQVDDFTFLLDCGWDETSDFSYLDSLIKYIPQIDAVLISYPDPYHLGALPYLVGKCGLQCPVYTTQPVHKMGQMFMYDIFMSRNNSADFTLFSLDDIDSAFDSITQLKYSQTFVLKGKGHGLQITPTVAGHMLGGSIWKIVKDGEDEIVYAIDYNHKKERHLNGCTLDEIGRPHILITDAYNVNYVQSRRRHRDEQLMTKILQTMRKNGNCLITVDTAGRILELTQLLDQMWRKTQSGLMAYSIAILSNVTYNVIGFAKSSVEWMSEKIQRSFEDIRNNPYHFKHIQLCHTMADLNQIPDPKVVLCSGSSLESGYSREIFTQWCENSNNSVVLTQRTQPGTLAHNLLHLPAVRNDLKLCIQKKVKLKGLELEEYLLKKKSEVIPKKEEINEPMEEDSSDSEDEKENIPDEIISSDNPSILQFKNKYDLMRNDTKSGRNEFFKVAKRGFPMFISHEEKVKRDAYGIVATEDDFNMFSMLHPKQEAQKKEEVVIEQEDTTVQQEVPKKCVSFIRQFDVKASIDFIDFEGRSDGESIKKLIAQIRPREMIIVHGNEESTSALADYCRTDIVQGRVFEPRLGEIVDATTDSHIYQVKLREELVSSLKFSKARDLELAWIDSLVDYDKSNTVDSQPTLVRPIEIDFHENIFINEPKLSDFKLTLQKADISSEFVAGALICEETVAIKKHETGKLQIEGCLSENYYKIRSLLYSQYAIL